MVVSHIQSALDFARLQKSTTKKTTGEKNNSINNKYLQVSSDPALNIKNQPIKLVYQAAVNKLNEHLEPFFGPEALKAGLAQGLDVSPEATAQRIVSMATGYYSAFESQHAEQSDLAVLDKFMQTIGNGIEQGFSEAKQILHGLSVLQGDIASNVDQTYVLVQQGLALFKSQQDEA